MDRVDRGRFEVTEWEAQRNKGSGGGGTTGATGVTGATGPAGGPTGVTGATGPTTVNTGGVFDAVSLNLYGSNIVWSRTATGTLDAGRGIVLYGTGATGAQTAFAGIGSLNEAGGTVTCKWIPSAATTTFLCNQLTSTPALLDGLLGATAGSVCAGPGIGCFSNLPL